MTVLPGRRYPELICNHDTLLENTIVVPGAVLAKVPASMRPLAHPPRGAVNSAGPGSKPWAVVRA